MPIKPENRARYPKNWKQIVEQVRERSGNRCEGSPDYPDCREAIVYSAPRHCPQCNSQRQGEKCWKCGTETITPAAGWEYPALPSIDRIRELAKEIGYAIGVHGSLERDLDLIAAPWSEEAAKLNYREVMEHIAKGLGAKLIEVEWKALGRRACTIQMDGYYKPIDLSVMPFRTGLELAGFTPNDDRATAPSSEGKSVCYQCKGCGDSEYGPWRCNRCDGTGKEPGHE